MLERFADASFYLVDFKDGRHPSTTLAGVENLPGVARRLVTFSCFAKNKVTKKKAPPVCRRCAVPCVARQVRRLRSSRCALRH